MNAPMDAFTDISDETTEIDITQVNLVAEAETPHTPVTPENCLEVERSNAHLIHTLFSVTCDWTKAENKVKALAAALIKLGVDPESVVTP